MHDAFFCLIKRFLNLPATVLFSFILAISPGSLLAAENIDQQKGPLWWETLVFLGNAADQSTDPAPDLIPYDSIKKIFHQRIVQPTSQLAGNQSPTPPQTPYVYNQTTNQVQKTQRDANLSSIQKDRRANYPTDMLDLESQPPRTDAPIGGSDVAPTGNWIKPVQAPRQSFMQVASTIINEQLDPNDHTGKIKILDTLQVIQHMVDCQAAGASATECFKKYVHSFAVSKAVSEGLSVLGQYGGWYLAKNAALGEAVLGGAATVSYLAYADYLAVQQIMEVCQIKINQYGDELANQRQAESNLGSDRFNWSGSLPELKTRLDLFQQQFDEYMIQAGDELFVAWGEADKGFSNVKKYREDLNKFLDSFLSPEDLGTAMEEACDQDDPGELGIKLETINEGIDQKKTLISKSLERAGALAKKCSTEEEAESIRAMHELLNGVTLDLEKDLQEWSHLIGEIDKKKIEAGKQKQEELVEEAKQAVELQEAYEAFTDTHFIASIGAWRSEEAYTDYIKMKKIFLQRWKRLYFFLNSRAEEILINENLEKAQAMLAATDSYLKGFKPSRMPFDSADQYKQEVEDKITELKYMEDVGVKLHDAIKERVQALENVQNPCEIKKESVEKDKWLALLKEQVNKLPQLARECVEVEIPDVVGMQLSTAVNLLQNLHLEVKPKEQDDVCLEQKICNTVSYQIPEKGRKRRRGSRVVLGHWGAYDKDAQCEHLQRKIGMLRYDKNLSEANRLLKAMRSLGCKESDDAALGISRAEQLQRDEKKIFLPKVIGYPIDQAMEKLRDAGFKIDSMFDVMKVATGDYTKNQQIKSQNPPGDTYQTKGAAVILTCWQFDSNIAVRDHKCSVKGSRATWNFDLNKTECVCPDGTVKITSTKRGARCAPCDDVKLYFDREITRGNLDRAEKIRKLAQERCLWEGQAQYALNQALAEEQAAATCNQQKKGSTPVPVGDGKYRCDCPGGTVDTKTRKFGAKCVPCNEMASHFDKATAANDLQRANKILNISRHCPWSQKGSQILADMQQPIQPAVQKPPARPPVPTQQRPPQQNQPTRQGVLTGTWSFRTAGIKPIKFEGRNLDGSEYSHDITGGNFSGTLHLTQSGQSLRGQLSAHGQRFPLDGTVNGSAVTICLSTPEGRECMPGTINYQRLTLSGRFPGPGNETWSAVKQR